MTQAMSDFVRDALRRCKEADEVDATILLHFTDKESGAYAVITNVGDRDENSADIIDALKGNTVSRMVTTNRGIEE